MAQKRNKNTRKRKKRSAHTQSNTQTFTQSLAQTAPTQGDALYGYTLQAIPCNLTEAEVRQAQLELFGQTNKISPKIWALLAVVTVVGVAGLFYFKGGQSIFFWILLTGVALYFLVKFVGMRWYVKRELTKQPVPDEMKNLKLGLQPHGLVMSMPQDLAMQQMQQRMGGNKANKSMMTMMKKNAGGDIPWSAMTDWKETPNFYVVMFNMKGQQGTQIIPKRLKHDNFPLENLAKHLKDNVTQA